jgi:hypothetical protein
MQLYAQKVYSMDGLDPAETYGSAVFAQAKSYGFNLQKFRLVFLRIPQKTRSR